MSAGSFFVLSTVDCRLLMFPRRVLIVLYTASGAAALVYEVVWTRLLTLQLGHTVAAASTVLAAFMGGLAVGAWAGGRFLSGRNFLKTVPYSRSGATDDRGSVVGDGLQTVPLLRIYAALEVAIAVLAVALPFALRGTV